MWQVVASLKSSLVGTLTSSSNKIANIVATSNKTSIISQVSNLALTVVQGIFVQLLYLLDTAATSDTTSKEFGKGIPDSTSVADIISSKGFDKGIPDPTTVANTYSVETGKNVVDPTTVANTYSVETGKNVTDSTSVASTYIVETSKNIPDPISIGDTIGRVVAFNRSYNDPTTIVDTGTLLRITYVDSSYFLEDYVGTASIF